MGNIMELRFPATDIKQFAKKYRIIDEEKKLIAFKSEVQRNECLNKDQLTLLAHWKSARSAGYVKKNDDAYIKEITSWAFHAKADRAKIEVLTLLDGVSWPTASVILHLFDKTQYPIIDFRALWSLGQGNQNQYSYSFWSGYVVFCRKLAEDNDIDMRTLDRALWQYSKENQKTKPNK